MYKVFLTKYADKSLDKLPKEYQNLFASCIQKLTQDPFSIDIKKLGPSYEATHRIRLGSYRIFLNLNSKSKEIIIYDITRRTSKTYRKN